jgi:hypothetical protein
MCIGFIVTVDTLVQVPVYSSPMLLLDCPNYKMLAIVGHRW